MVSLLLGLSVSLPASIRAAAAAETRAYDVALNFFQGRAYDLAEKELAGFIKDHPDSEKVPEAVLLQAQCRYQLKRLDEALTLLRDRLAKAGTLADRYRYWIAECLFEKGDYPSAASAFAQVLNDFPDSSRRLDASVGEAYARFKAGDLQRTVDLLSRPDGAFQLAVKDRMGDESAVRGHLLLGEAYLGLRQYQSGEETLQRLADPNLPPELKWQRLYLLARLQLAGGQLDPALQTTTNLLYQLSAVTNALSSSFKSDAAALQGEIFEQKGEPEAAIRAYEPNLSTNAAPARRQQALQQIVSLTLAQNKISEAGKRLETFVAQNPNDPSLDLLRLTLGELRLKEYFAAPEAGRPNATNLLLQAESQFDQIIANTNAQFVAKAQLDRGWCLWELAQDDKATNHMAESLAAFRAATEQLPRSDDQAVAHFKRADCQFALGAYAGALTNYWTVATNYTDLPKVQDELIDQALYQIVRASIQLRDLTSADLAVKIILAEYPSGELNDRSLLLYGQAVSHLNTPTEARKFFEEFIERLPDSPMLPEVELAVARTYELEGNWKEASRLYEEWVVKHPDHSSRPKAEFDRACASDRAGNETNAFEILTNFVTRFPANELAPQAQYWIADHFYRLGGTNYVKAEENYQKVFQNTNWQNSTLVYQSLKMAGLAAYKRQGYSDAVGYFTNLINSLNKEGQTASSLLPEVYFALADTYVASPKTVPGATNVLDGYKAALDALGHVTTVYSTDALAPLAWGRMGDYYAQLTNYAKNYERATEAYTNAMTNELADVTCRSAAEFGLAGVLERQASEASASSRTNLLNEALQHYLYVVYGKNLRDGEKGDPYWVKEAAVAAARLAEDQQRFDVAAELYKRLRDELAPPLRKTWDAKLEKLAQLHIRAQSPPN